MDSQTIWAFVPLLLLGGIGYAIYLIVRPEPGERTNSLAPPMGSAESQSEIADLYEIVAEELRTNSLKQGLWLKAFAEADADEPKARAAYIRYRVAELQADRPTKAASSGPDTERVPSRPIPRWKQMARGVLMLFTWMMVVTGVLGVLLSSYVQDFENPQSRRFAGQAGLYAIVGVGILSAVYARRRKAMWFLIGVVGAFVGVMAASVIVTLLRNAFA